jgi:hypothetical protein
VPKILQIFLVEWINWRNKLTYQKLVTSSKLVTRTRDHTMGLMGKFILGKAGSTTNNMFTNKKILTLTDIHQTVATRPKRVRVKLDNTNEVTTTHKPP